MKKFFRTLAIVLCLSVFTPSVIPNIGTETVQAATKIKLNYTKKTIYVGKSFKLKITGTKKKVKWSSSNKKIATVSSKGVVKGIGEGTAKITAKVGKKKYTCKVNVKDWYEDSNDNNNENNNNYIEPKVNYISNRTVQYNNDNSEIQLLFVIQDQNNNEMKVNGHASIYITNGDQKVYSLEKDFTESDFSIWTKNMTGEKHLECCITIPYSDIEAGKNNNGKIYCTITGDGYSFDEYYLNLRKLPKEQRKIEVDTTSYISDRFNPENKVQIINYNISDNKIYITYKMVQVGNPNIGNFGTYIYQYDKNGNIVDEIYVYTNNLTVGSTFIDSDYLKDDTVRIGINASSNGSTGNDNNSTIPKPTGSVSENIAQLKQYIKNNGKTNINGNKFISYSNNDQTSSIVYESQTDSLLFVTSGEDIGLTMKMTSTNNSSTMQADFVMYSSDIGIMATGYVDPSSYNLDSNVRFTISKENTGILKDDDVQDLCNSELRVGFTGWQIVLFNNLIMTLKDIGFTSYE